MNDLFDDPRWDTFGLLKESFLSVQAAMMLDIGDSAQLVRPELRDLLIRLARSENHCLRPGTLSRGLSMSPSSMTRLIDQAAALTFVTRKPDPEDRRAYLVVLTDSGLTETKSWASASLESSVSHTSAHLSQAEIRTLESLLRRIRDNAQQHAQLHTQQHGSE